MRTLFNILMIVLVFLALGGIIIHIAGLSPVIEGPAIIGMSPEQQGRMAFFNNQDIDSNPYPQGTISFSEWNNGYAFGREGLQEDQVLARKIYSGEGWLSRSRSLDQVVWQMEDHIIQMHLEGDKNFMAETKVRYTLILEQIK